MTNWDAYDRDLRRQERGRRVHGVGQALSDLGSGLIWLGLFIAVAVLTVIVVAHSIV